MYGTDSNLVCDTMITIDVSDLTKYIAQLKEANLVGQVTRITAFSGLSILKNRIHEQGKAADGGDIGIYSTSPIYVGKKAVGGGSIKPVGKYGETIFKSGEKKGQPHKTEYFPEGYKGYKTKIGRNQTGKVNLSLSGQLNQQTTVIPNNKDWGIGWEDSEKYKRAKALEKKYGKVIWGFTDRELEILSEVANAEAQRIINGIR